MANQNSPSKSSLYNSITDAINMSLKRNGCSVGQTNDHCFVGTPGVNMASSICFQRSSVESLDETIKLKIAKMPSSIILNKWSAPVRGPDHSKAQAEPPSQSSTMLNELCSEADVDQWAGHNLAHPALFGNEGNACYMNAVLQCLMAACPLVGFAVSNHNDPKLCKRALDGKFCTLCEFSRILRLHSRVNKVIYHWRYTRHIKDISPSLSHYDQEDAHEFLLGLLTSMEEALLVGKEKMTPSYKDTNPIRRIFGGVLKSQVTCTVCDTVSSRDEPMFDLSLDITSGSNLTECLARYTRGERLVGSNAYKCEKCKQLRSAVRRCTISKSPRILVMQFNRFSGDHRKINDNIRFPFLLNMRPFMTDSGGPNVTYRLFATLNHKGSSCRSGHYVAYSRRGQTWLCSNDDDTQTVSREEVERSHPYLLFYEKVKNPVVSRKPTGAAAVNSHFRYTPRVNGFIIPVASKFSFKKSTQTVKVNGSTSQSSPKSNGGQSAPQTNGGQSAPQTNSGQSSPKSNGGQSAPKSNGGQSAPKSNGGQSAPQTNSGQSAPKSNGGQSSSKSSGVVAPTLSNNSQLTPDELALKRKLNGDVEDTSCPVAKATRVMSSREDESSGSSQKDTSGISPRPVKKARIVIATEGEEQIQQLRKSSSAPDFCRSPSNASIQNGRFHKTTRAS